MKQQTVVHFALNVTEKYINASGTVRNSRTERPVPYMGSEASNTHVRGFAPGYAYAKIPNHAPRKVCQNDILSQWGCSGPSSHIVESRMFCDLPPSFSDPASAYATKYANYDTQT